MHRYGDRMELRLLDEILFWSVQGREHAGVLKELLDTEKPFKEELSRFEEKFGKVEGKAIQYTESLARSDYRSPHLQPHTLRLAQKAYKVNHGFIRFLQHFLKESKAAKSPVARTLINHIKNETEYFLGIIRGLGILPSKKQPKPKKEPYTPPPFLSHLKHPQFRKYI